MLACDSCHRLGAVLIALLLFGHDSAFAQQMSLNNGIGCFALHGTDADRGLLYCFGQLTFRSQSVCLVLKCVLGSRLSEYPGMPTTPLWGQVRSAFSLFLFLFEFIPF